MANEPDNPPPPGKELTKAELFEKFQKIKPSNAIIYGCIWFAPLPLPQTTITQTPGTALQGTAATHSTAPTSKKEESSNENNFLKMVALSCVPYPSESYDTTDPRVIARSEVMRVDLLNQPKER
ncbi:MAG: hypothetical protein ACK5O1_07085 [Holosporales bacterium]|jgi:hypothetical protein